MGSSQGCQYWRCPHGAGVGWVRVMPESKGGWYGHSPFCSYCSKCDASYAIKSSTRIFVSSVSWQLTESVKEKGHVCLWGRLYVSVDKKFVSKKKKKRNLSQKEFQNFDPAGIPIGICWDSRKWGMQPEGLPRDQPH